jgi:hypothetical protein
VNLCLQALPVFLDVHVYQNQSRRREFMEQGRPQAIYLFEILIIQNIGLDIHLQFYRPHGLQDEYR